MTILNIETTAIVLESVVAIQFDPPYASDESVRVFFSGMCQPIELYTPDPEKTFLEICAAIAKLKKASDPKDSFSNPCPS
jgi:hypothetical protein